VATVDCQCNQLIEKFLGRGNSLHTKHKDGKSDEECSMREIFLGTATMSEREGVLMLFKKSSIIELCEIAVDTSLWERECYSSYA